MGLLSSRLKKARTSLGLTQKDVVETTGISRWRLYRFESGKCQPRMAELKKLAELYRKPLGYFLQRAKPKSQPILWCRISETI